MVKPPAAVDLLPPQDRQYLKGWLKAKKTNITPRAKVLERHDAVW
jgi:hypothetical protein